MITDIKKRELALKYLKHFCAGDIDGLAPLLAPDLVFSGPLYTYDSSEEYLNSLRNDPPEKCGYKILDVADNPNSVAVFYEYHKPDRKLLIAQLFKIKDRKINSILLIFDGRGFD